MSTNRIHCDVVHPKTDPTRPMSMGKFKKGDTGGRSRVADMVMAYNAKSGGDLKSSGVKIKLKRTCSAGSVSLSSPQSEGGELVHHSCGTYRHGPGRRRSDEPSDANLGQRNSLQDGEVLRGAVLLNGDQSSDDSEEEGEIRTMQKKYLTQSLGRNEYRNVMPRGSMVAGKRGGVQHGKLVDNLSEEESDDDIEVDKRVQNTFAHFKKGTLERQVATVAKPPAKSQVIKPIGVTATGGYHPSGKGPSFKRTSGPRLQGNSSSPKHSDVRTSFSSTRLRMASAADPLEKTPSPRDSESAGRSKIESNPFFQQDRLNCSKSRVAVLQTQERRSSAPPTSAPKQSDINTAAGMGIKKNVSAVSKSTDELAEPVDRKTPIRGLSPARRDYKSSSPSWKSSSSPEATPAHSPAGESVGIQMRIKLWADKEKEAKGLLHKSPSPPRRNVQKKESTLCSNQLGTKQKSIPDKTANCVEDNETVQTEIDDIYDDVIVQTVPQSSNVMTKRKVVGEQTRSPGDLSDEDEYEDIIVTSSDVKRLPPPPSAEDEVYDDVEAPTKSQVPLPSGRRRSSAARAVAENSESVYEEDLYATIPGEIYENPLEESEEIPPELPPRPDHLCRKEPAATANGVIYELEDEIYDDIDPETSENSPNVSKSGSPPSPIKGEKSSPLKGKNKAKEMSPKPGRSKWSQIFRSPVLSKRKKMEERSNSLLDERELEKGKIEVEGKQQGIASRASRKRTAIRKKRSTNTDSVDLQTDGAGAGTESDERALDSENESNECDDVFASKSSSSAQQLQTDLKSSELPCSMNEESYVTVVDKKLDPHSEIFVISPPESSEGSVASDQPRQAAKGKGVGKGTASSKSARKKLRKNRTLSREIYEIINSMGTEGCVGVSTIHEEDTGEKISLTPPERMSEQLLMSSSLSVPTEMRSFHSDSALNVSSTKATGDCSLRGPLLVVNDDIVRGRSSSSPQPIRRDLNDPTMFDTSGDSSSDMEPNAPTCDGEGTIQSSLDRGETRLNRKRLRMKSELSDGSPSRTVVSTSFKEKYLTSPVMQRNNSLTPSEEGSEGVILTSLMYADVVWDRVAVEDDELSFRVGDVIEILDMTDDIWWHGSVQEDSGWFPSTFVRLRIGQESDSEDTTPVTTKPEQPHPVQHLSLNHTPTRSGSSIRRRMTIRRKDSAPDLPKKLSPSEVRAKIVEEILNTERVYVQNLEDIVEGYLKRCIEYSKLFDTERVETIFSNIEQIYNFQRDFLRELEARINLDRMEDSQIGEVFVMNRHGFAIYSEYCNNHPHTVNEMNTLQQNEQYTFFFESCRLLRNLQDISLEGFLLTPVQKICKYPLQLFELLKYTSDDHPDHPHVVAAQQAMKEVAMLINEHKRRMENIGKIGRWQATIDNWKGESILESSTELVHSGELHKISKGHSQERHFFLFDRQLIYCKKDTIGGKLAYKGRLDLDNCQIIDLPDGSILHGNTSIKNSWRMNNQAKDKWIIIYAKSAEVKKQWMDAFERERQRVKEDEERGFRVCMRMKKAAVTLSDTDGVGVRRRRRSFHRKHVQGVTESVDGVARYKIDSSSNSKKLITVSEASPSSKKGKGRQRKTQVGSPMLPRKIH